MPPGHLKRIVSVHKSTREYAFSAQTGSCTHDGTPLCCLVAPRARGSQIRYTSRGILSGTTPAQGEDAHTLLGFIVRQHVQDAL